MSPAEVTDLATSLLRQHGLHNWQFQFDRARNRLGSCNYHTRTVSISRHLLADDSPAETVLETLLHEIAHALVGPGHAHDPIWQAQAMAIGAEPRATTRARVLPAPRWQLVCRHCHNVVARRHQRRLNLQRVACRDCGPVDGRLFWREDELEAPVGV